MFIQWLIKEDRKNEKERKKLWKLINLRRLFSLINLLGLYHLTEWLTRNRDIFDNNSSYTLSELSATWSRCETLQQSKKKKVIAFTLIAENRNERSMCSLCSFRSRLNDLVDKKRFKLHDQLKKIESFLTTQIRIEKIDFASFSSSSQDSWREIDFLSMRLKQLND